VAGGASLVVAVSDPVHPPGWRLIRVTALFLSVGLPLHAWTVLVRDDIGRTTFVTVSERLDRWWWPGVEWATLALALLHGVLVIRARLVATVAPGPARSAAVGAVALAATGLGAGVTHALVTFSS
jgi:succinate dehydrogenase hydrophobic anchor subunit